MKGIDTYFRYIHCYSCKSHTVHCYLSYQLIPMKQCNYVQVWQQNFHALILKIKPYNLKHLLVCALAHIHISPVFFPLLHIMMNLGIYLSTIYFLKRKSQHWFKSNYAAETRDYQVRPRFYCSETRPAFYDHMSRGTQRHKS